MAHAHQDAARRTAAGAASERWAHSPVAAAAWWSVAAPVSLIALGLVLYANAGSAPFILDDRPHIVGETAIKPPLSVRHLLAHNRPMVTASLAFNYAVGGLDVRGYHLFNVAAHVACALLVYGLVRATLRLPRLRARFGAASTALAWTSAALFLAHPIQTESVTYVIQRAEIFAALAMLLAMWIAVYAAQQPASGVRAGVRLLALAAAAAFGVFSKETAVVLPALFALYDWCFLAAGRVRVLLQRWPIYLTLFLVTAAAVGVRGWQIMGGEPLGGVTLSSAQQPEAGAQPAPTTEGPEPLTAWRYLRWQFGVCVYYVRLILWPNRLCFDCGLQTPWPVRSSLLGEAVWFPALLLAAVSVVAWWLRPRYPLATFCVLGAALLLAPTSSILPLMDVYVEHRLYLPIAFVALLVVVVVFDAATAVVQRGWFSAPVARTLCTGATVVAIVTLSWLTVVRNRLYADPMRLWEDSVAQAPRSVRALFNLGNEYGRRGQSAEAIDCFQRLIRLEPAPTYYINLGNQYLKLGRFTAAVGAFEQARQLEPTWAIVQRNLSVAYARMGRVADALAAAERATQLEPLDAWGFKLLGDAYRRAGRPDDARKAYASARTLEAWERQGRPGFHLGAPER
jgi:tetratricopeptide (TPR) repeat protein